MFRDDGCERPGRDVQGYGFRPGRACAGHRGDHGLGSKSRLVPGTAAAAAAPVGVKPEDVMATLEKLGELKSKGILTDDEFNAKKAELLKKLV